MVVTIEGKNAYELLEVSKDAGDEKIKKAYRQLVRELHPDTRGRQTEDHIKRINWAYEQLENAEKRRIYDKQLAADEAREAAQKLAKRRAEEARRRREAHIRSPAEAKAYAERAMGTAKAQPTHKTPKPPPQRPANPSPEQPTQTRSTKPPPFERPTSAPPTQPTPTSAPSRPHTATAPSRTSQRNVLISASVIVTIIVIAVIILSSSGPATAPSRTTEAANRSSTPATPSSARTSKNQRRSSTRSSSSTTSAAKPPFSRCSTPAQCAEAGANAAAGTPTRAHRHRPHVKTYKRPVPTVAQAHTRPKSTPDTTTNPTTQQVTTAHTSPQTPPPSNTRIAGVQAEQVGSHAYRVSWDNPHDPSIAGWIISQKPSRGSSSGAPVRNPEISSEEVTDESFAPQFKFRPGLEYTICVTPYGHGLMPGGNYPEMSEREGCAAPFTWK